MINKLKGKAKGFTQHLVASSYETKSRTDKDAKTRKLGAGFTIIEVLIVLAIAGLILTIVFIAVPQLQRNTRDSKRQSIATRLSTELQNFASNNQGKFPFAAATGSVPGFNCRTGTSATDNCRGWYDRYINGTPKIDTDDPRTGSPVDVYNTTSTSALTWAVGRVYIGSGLKCSGEGFQTGSGGTTNAKDFAIVIGLERSYTWFCVDNG